MNAISMSADQGRRNITLSHVITGTNSAGNFCTAVHKAECRLCENALVLNGRTFICCRHLCEGDWFNTALCLKIIGTVSILDSS